jgi:transposase
MSDFYLGCDASKGYADFVLTDHQKQIVESNFQLDDTCSGHRKLEQVLESFFEKNPEAVLYAAVESTGGYENNWFRAFKMLGVRFPVKAARLNPIGVSHHKKAALKRNSTDKISALTIAEYQINYPEVIRYDEDDRFHGMKKLFTAYRMLKKIRTQLLNQLESLIYTAQPQLVKYRKDNTPLWMLRLLNLYPDAESLANAAVEDVDNIPFITSKRAAVLIGEAASSVASAADKQTKVLIRLMTSQVLDLDRSIHTLEKEANDFADVHEVSLIRSIKSIGLMSAIGLFIQLKGDISLFAHSKKVSAFWGIHPALKDSGDGSMVPKMSKKGRSEPRRILYMVVLNGIKCNGFISETYKRELKKGKCRMSAIGVCMNKLSRIIFGVLKNNTPFDPEINRRHQLRSQPKSSAVKPKSNKRRFQQEDPGAPISRRQTKKRKEQEQSQSEQVTSSEIESLPLAVCS